MSPECCFVCQFGRADPEFLEDLVGVLAGIEVEGSDRRGALEGLGVRAAQLGMGSRYEAGGQLGCFGWGEDGEGTRVGA